MTYGFMLGNVKELAVLEIKAVLSRYQIDWQPAKLSDQVFGLSCQALPKKLFFDLGGSVRLFEIIAVLEKSSSAGIEEKLVNFCRRFFEEKENAGKENVGFSSINAFSKPRLLNIAKKVKKELKKNNRRIRFLVPEKGTVLSAATLSKHGLTEDGLELVVFSNSHQLFIAKTISIQNVDAWAQRDIGKPNRQQKKGMLPPKLARMMLNIALPFPLEPKTPAVLDPFCGTGTVLIEAMELGLFPFGIDINPEQVSAARKNLVWLNELLGREIDPEAYILHADATNLDKIRFENQARFDAIVTEPTLGPALLENPKREAQEKTAADLKRIYFNFLKSARQVLKPNAMVVMAFPRWSKISAFSQIVDELKELGYDLINKVQYSREGQFVSREIAILRLKTR